MNELELERRLQRIDPVLASAPVDPLDGPRARALMEQIMSTTPVETKPSRPGWLPVAVAGAAAAVLAGIGIAAWSARSTGSDPTVATYELQASDPMAMCLAIAEAPPPPAGAVAFAGTVTEVTPSDVMLDVERTFAGDEADVVKLTTGPDVTNVALDGVEFVAGDRYLVTVVDGQVQTCGASGPVSPELEAVYGRWFG